jgi:hypothetical protein
LARLPLDPGPVFGHGVAVILRDQLAEQRGGAGFQD